MNTFKKIFSLFLAILFSSYLIAGHAANIPYQPLTPPLPATAGKEIITPEWLLSHSAPSLDQPSISWLNKNTLIYSFPLENNDQIGHIETINVISHQRQLLTDGLTPVPSPDGKWIAYTKGKNENLQLWIIQSNGLNNKQISHIEGGLSGYYRFQYNIAWSADSKKIILSHQKMIEPWEHQKQAESKIDVIDISSGQSQEIASIDGSVRYLSANNNIIFFVKERVGFEYNVEEDHEWIESLDINGKNLQTILHFSGLQQWLLPTVSPDGKKMAFTYDPDVPFYSIIGSIGLVDLNNSNQITSIKRLTREINLAGPKWSNKKHLIYALRLLGAYNQIYSINTITGKLNQITNAPLDILKYGLSPDGTQLAWIGEDAHAKYTIRIANSDGSNTKNIAVINPYSNDLALSEVREIEWKTIDYPSPIRGLLMLPLNYQPGKKYPLIVDIHGGGISAHIAFYGGLLTSTSLEWQLWAAKGYAVFVPELRSSGSFGSLAITRDAQNFDDVNCDIKDVNSGVDYLIDQGIADANRLAVIGHSAGSQRANWLAVTTHRYKVVISHDGWADSLIETVNNEAVNNNSISKRITQFFGGTPQEVPQNYTKNSSLTHSAGATTPILFLAGNIKLGGIGGSENDKGSLPMLYHALKNQGVEADYIYYPDEGHVFEKPTNQQDMLNRAIRWIDKYLGNGIL